MTKQLPLVALTTSIRGEINETEIFHEKKKLERIILKIDAGRVHLHGALKKDNTIDRGKTNIEIAKKYMV